MMRGETVTVTYRTDTGKRDGGNMYCFNTRSAGGLVPI